MSIEQSLQDFVVSDLAVAALVVHNNSKGTSFDHMFPVFAPEIAVAPYITYRRSSTQRERNMSGPTGQAKPQFEINCWATTYSGAIALAGAVRAAVDGHDGYMGDEVETVGHAFVLDESDVFEPYLEVTQRLYYGRRLVIEVWHSE